MLRFIRNFPSALLSLLHFLYRIESCLYIEHDKLHCFDAKTSIKVFCRKTSLSLNNTVLYNESIESTKLCWMLVFYTIGTV